ncbi:MAG: gspG [Candidatus Nomurabacteria bacterium]|nr:gspG [Candidatus Nomurabacteria bacterium]
MFQKKQNKGFTLIELLVVIAIIGILASVILASLNTARAKARDAQRIQDINSIRTALELYANDNGGAYPSNGRLWWGNCSTFGSHNITGANGYIPNLAPTYIPTLPLDPKPDNRACYVYKSDGVDYMFLVFESVEGTVPAGLQRPSNPAEKSYAIYTPAAAMW